MKIKSRAEPETTVEIRCPVDHILFLKCTPLSNGRAECYCRRCKTCYVVDLPSGVPEPVKT